PLHHLTHQPLSSHHTAPTETSTLSLHDALPISTPHARHHGARQASVALHHLSVGLATDHRLEVAHQAREWIGADHGADDIMRGGDRKSTRLNSSHVKISYAVFCLKKKKKKQ